jgi:isopentenyl-diphosphate delta-isomerase
MTVNFKEEKLIAVDSTDKQIGEVTKSEAHQKGILHRAFSVFIFNSKGEWLLQQRALNKYHSGGLWSNACCGHPNTGEQINEAASNRLIFEMGLQTEIKNIFPFYYKAAFENGLTEHEYDHIYTGKTDITPSPNPDEVESYRYVSFEELENEVNQIPEKFTEWFKMVYKQVNEAIRS